MSYLKNETLIGVIGLGLIGGSLAKTIHRIYPDISILAYDINSITLDLALAEGTISQGFSEIGTEFSKCRYIFLCAPVKENLGFIQQLAPFLRPECILSDTGSTKSEIHHAITNLGLSPYFIGGHPMAGSEKIGYENSTAYLFENAYYLLTAEDVIPKQIDAFQNFIASLGCVTLVTNPDKHDYMTATISHLPHVLAASLVNLVKQLDDKEENMKAIAAGGFKDITRIASSSPQMWQEICLSNHGQIHLVLNDMLSTLEGIRKEIQAENSQEILDFFRQAKDYRDSINIGISGPISKIYEVYCDLIDEAGGIAAIATLLAEHGINIKNIGIIHNREFEEGVLRIELYEEKAQFQTNALLRENNYLVYRR